MVPSFFFSTKYAVGRVVYTSSAVAGGKCSGVVRIGDFFDSSVLGKVVSNRVVFFV